MNCKGVDKDMGEFKIEAVETEKGYKLSVKAQGLDKHTAIGLLEAAKHRLLTSNESS